MKRETSITLHESKALRESYYDIRHKSGLHIYFIPKELSVTYALFATKYGSIDNVFRLAGEKAFTKVPEGIAHFLEHKMFEAEDGTDTFERFAKVGASANAFTSNDMTAYEFSCTDNVYEALEILLDYVTHPYFTKENVEKEQGIIGQEIQMCDDNPMRRLYQELLSNLYSKDGVRINICGTKDTIAQITPELLYRCYNTFYQLSNMAIVICGKADCEGIISVVDKFLTEQNEIKIDRYFEAEPKEIAKKRSVVPMSVGRPLFAIGIKDDRIPALGPDDAKHAATLQIAGDLLFGASSDFYNQMYDEGLLNSAFSCGYEMTRTCGFFMLWGETDDPEVVYDRVLSWITEKKENPPLEEDFLRLKRMAYGAHMRIYDSSSEIAYAFLSDLFAGVDLFEGADIIASITYEDVLKEIATFFKAERFSMSVIIPAEEMKNA